MVPRDARPLPLRAAPGQGELPRRTRTAYAGIQQLAHDANLLFYASEEAQEGREAYKEKRTPDFSKFPRRPDAATTPHARAAMRIWLMAARLRTLPAAVAPVLVGTALAGHRATFQPLALRRRAARRDLHPGRHQPLQRLLRRAPRRRHRGPPRAGARHRRRARARRARCWSRPTWPSGWRCCAASTWSPSPAGSCCSSAPPRSSPACSTPAARGPTATRASARCSCSCSSASSRSTGSYFVQVEQLTWEAFVLRGAGRPAGQRDPRGQQRARPRDRPARRQAHAGGAARPRAHAHAVRG